MTSRPIFAVVLLALYGATAAHAQTVRYIHTDALGSPIAVTNASRTLIEISEYEPYGQVVNRPVNAGPGYTGHVMDVSTGLAYMQQRYYDPGLGRFLSVDPLTANSNTGSNFNRYWYANNNPYRFIDPDGRVAIITHNQNGSITIQVPMKFTGPQATAANISSIKSGASAAFSGTHQISGTSTQVNFQVVDITSSTPAAAHNEVQLISGTTSHPTGRSFVNAVGGTSGEINMNSRGIAHGEASHEMGHFAGAQDHYSYTTGQVDAAYAGNLMGQLPGTVDSRNISEMLTNSTNIIRHEPPPQLEEFVGPR